MTSPARKEAQTEAPQPTEAQMEAAALLVVLALDKVRQKKVAGGIDLIAQALAASHDEGHREGMTRAAKIARDEIVEIYEDSPDIDIECNNLVRRIVSDIEAGEA